MDGVLSKSLAACRLSLPLPGAFAIRFYVRLPEDSSAASAELNLVSRGRSNSAYFSLPYSALASFRIGVSGSASFHRVRNS